MITLVKLTPSPVTFFDVGLRPMTQVAQRFDQTLAHVG
jgi:hypothetical protein